MRYKEKMNRVLPDTNFYEFMLKYIDIDKIRKVKESGIIVFYGVDLIRKELRATPKTRMEVVRNELLKLRNVLLSIYGLNDNKTMLSAESKKAYNSVNQIKKLRTPNFIGFEEFKNLLRGVKLG